MKELVLQRIIRLSKEKSNSENQFAKLIGVNQRTINQQLKKEPNPGIIFLYRQNTNTVL